jgi:putative ABC transport system substrate-binding protein
MRRREFIAALAGAVAATPALGRRVASAQQTEKVRRIGVLMGLSESNPVLRGFLSAFEEELARLGWVDGRNATIERRWTNADVTRAGAFAKELIALQPDVILASTTPVTAALHRETTTIPIVFAITSDPVGAEFVAGLSHPGGNITGFAHTDAALGGKWLGLLKEIAPGIKRAAIMFNPDTAPGRGSFFLGSFEAAAPSVAVEPVTLPVHTEAEIETAITAVGRTRCGLVVMDDSFMAVHYRAVVAATARNNVPTISAAYSAEDGALISYLASIPDLFRGAAG